MVKRILVLVLALALLGAGFWYVRKTERAEQMHIQEMYRQIEPLQEKQLALKKELENLDAEFENRSRDFSTLQILFREMSAPLYTEVYQQMRGRGITGLMGLSMINYPGTGNNITADQYQSMIADGWGICYYYDGEFELDFWLTNLESWLRRDGYGVPTSIYIPQGYTAAMDEVLARHGITTLVTDSADGSTVAAPDTDGLWKTGAMVWNYKGVINDLQLLAQTDGGNLILRVSFSGEEDAYNKSSFERCLATLQELTVNLNQEDEAEKRTGDGILLMGFDEARKWHLQAEADSLKQEEEYAARRAELEAQLEAVSEEISAAYARWKND